MDWFEALQYTKTVWKGGQSSLIQVANSNSEHVLPLMILFCVLKEGNEHFLKKLFAQLKQCFIECC